MASCPYTTYKHHSHCTDKEICGSWVTKLRLYFRGGSKGQQPKGCQRIRNSEDAFISALSAPRLVYHAVHRAYFSTQSKIMLHITKTNTVSQHHLISDLALIKSIMNKPQSTETAHNMRTPSVSKQQGFLSTHSERLNRHKSSVKTSALPSETKVCMVFMVSGQNPLPCVHIRETLYLLCSKAADLNLWVVSPLIALYLQKYLHHTS